MQNRNSLDYHWWPDRVHNHIRLCFLGFWISARLGTTVGSEGFHRKSSQSALPPSGNSLCPTLYQGKACDRALTPDSYRALLQKLDLLPLFAHPPKWAL
ncbi:hypothetical protein IT6_09465 [Methylacidiphilum caldifontis]|uniref:hypothetical protein n=1 Tax=Methylacidiphilum caldifontis TaxID=2795386 RepID=UPI001A8F379C|nr:hypothetical protein [Methylacidiphilum caldifontis]QSR88577.1 hypothetical protein IT6_09465 [Methylacidiphilum caldifontis]